MGKQGNRVIFLLCLLCLFLTGCEYDKGVSTGGGESAAAAGEETESSMDTGFRIMEPGEYDSKIRL